ncbi:MAG: hypothetical protein ACNA7M_15275 [Roseovarius sp.]
MSAQSRRMSLIEAATNVAVGYALAVATQIMVFPWFGLHPSISENLAIGAVFVGISLLRSYALRRLFERWRDKSGVTGRQDPRL